MEKLKEEIVKFGKKVVREKLCTSFFGNISIKKKNNILITAAGTMLDVLDESKIVVCDMNKITCENASTEFIVHKEIYLNNKKVNAIIHTHSFFSVLMAKTEENLNFDDYEFANIIGKIKVVEGKSGSIDLSKKIGEVAAYTNLVIVKNHGVFCWGKDLSECYIYISALEFYAKMKFYEKLITIKEI